MIINPDRAVVQKDFRNAPPDTLRVTSVFHTIQGEGPDAGKRALFIRLSGCNYGAKNVFCKFCDTAFQFDEGRYVTFHELYEYRDYGLIVLTGGEPLLQPNILPFIEGVRSSTKVQIESNGTQRSIIEQLPKWVSLIVSPKVGNGVYAKPSPSVMERADALKFVVSADPDDQHHLLPDWIDEYRGEVYISPIAVYKRPYVGEVSSAWDHTLIDPIATGSNYMYAARLVMETGYRLSIQQHLFTAMP